MALRLPGIGSHHSANPKTDEWLTPPHIVEACGPFDLDPCTPMQMPWRTAERMLTVEDDGLSAPWEGAVWLNPPYSDAAAWMARLARHGDGIALVFARTETSWWFEHIWPHAHRLLFLQGRLTFHHSDGSRSRTGHNAGGPSVLVAYGARCADRLDEASRTIAGAICEVR